MIGTSDPVRAQALTPVATGAWTFTRPPSRALLVNASALATVLGASRGRAQQFRSKMPSGCAEPVGASTEAVIISSQHCTTGPPISYSLVKRRASRRPLPVRISGHPGQSSQNQLQKRNHRSRSARMSLTRIHNLSISLDGFATGEPQSADAPFGHAGERLHEWLFATRFWDAGGTAGVDDAFAERHSYGIGAEIMGANKFGPPGWQDDLGWKGWWGPNPPFHTPTFVLTHRPRPSIEMEGGTTFHFLDTAPAEALKTAREAADGQDVRIGGGATVVRDFLAAGLVDHMHLVQVPIVLGRGVRIWDGLEALEDAYNVEAVSSPSGVTHLTFTRKVVS
jgi:dihydrofolate reductase